MQQTISPVQTVDNTSFVRSTLWGNAFFSMLSALALLFGSQPIAGYMGIGSPGWLLAVGVGLLIFALDVAWMASRPQLDRRALQAIFVLDVAWVVGSIVLLVTGWLPFTTAGKWAIAIVADVVAVFAILEYVGLRKLHVQQ